MLITICHPEAIQGLTDVPLLFSRNIFDNRKCANRCNGGPAHLVFASSAPERGADATSNPSMLAKGDAIRPRLLSALHGTVACGQPAGLTTARYRMPTGTRSSGSSAEPPAVASTWMRLSRWRMKQLSHLINTFHSAVSCGVGSSLLWSARAWQNTPRAQWHTHMLILKLMHLCGTCLDVPYGGPLLDDRQEC